MPLPPVSLGGAQAQCGEGGGAMAEGPRPKRRREEEEEDEKPGAAPHDGAAAAAPFPLAELRLRRVLRESARDKAVFLHGEVPAGTGEPGGPDAIFHPPPR